MRYLGSKNRILPYISALINKYNITGTTFADLFSGTGCVGDYFKDKYKIITNDFLRYASYLSKAKLMYKNIPEFKKFKKKYNQDIFDWLNGKDYQANETYFIYHNYTPAGKRNFFTKENGIRIDGIRQEIEDLSNNGLIDKDNEYIYLLACLVESATKVANISGTFEAYFKFLDSRALAQLNIEPLTMNITSSLKSFESYDEDTNKLVRHIEGDIAYIDTPYTVTQYVSAYHLLETIVRYDNPSISGVGGKRDREGKNSLYARKNEALYQFEDLFRQIKFKHIIVSYSNQGLVQLKDLINLAKKFAVNNEVFVEYIDYQEYQNHRSSNKGKPGSLNEVLIYFKKDMKIIKSPLNYSGSKDKMFQIINRELPYHIENFVDVMGGAFNVGINVVALKSVTYNEIDKNVYETVEWLLSNDSKYIQKSIENCIKKYNLKKGNESAFKKLREDYNQKPTPVKLFVLHMYSFQNMIRYNSSHEFNTPIGVAGYSSDMIDRINEFIPKTQKLNFMNKDFIDIKWDKFSKDTIFYFDPPYYITNASYNDGKRGGKGWTIKEEMQLLNTLSELDAKGYKFLLSNVINHKGKTHTLLLNWVHEHNYHLIEAGVSGWRYAKNEVIVKNFER